MLLNRRVKILFFALIILASVSYYFDFASSTFNKFFNEEDEPEDNLYSNENYLDYYPEIKKRLPIAEPFIINTPGCQIPETYKSKKSSGKGFGWGRNSCTGWSFTFMKNGNILSLNKTKSTGRKAECCYNVIKRESDTDVRLEGPCKPLFDEKLIDTSVNFVQVSCSYISGYATEFHYILHPVIKANERKVLKNSTHKSNSLNKQEHVIIIGIDSVAREHLHQYMPKTKKALEQLGAVEFHGYNKVGENTHPNIVPLLTGYPLSSWPCNHSADSYLDACPFLWKELKSKTNFMTAFAEDAPKLAIFNYKKVGFLTAPTDFYLRPLMSLANNVPPYTKTFMFPCIGSAISTENFLLKYIQDLLQYSETQLNRPLFALNWLTTLAHDNTQNLERNDYLFSKFFEKVNAKHPNSYILFMSDHGYRHDNIKYKRNSRNGWFLEKLPFLFIKVPNVKNWPVRLRKNSRKLVTPYDVHKTLRVLMQLPFDGTKGDLLPGQSLFDSVPTTRNCESAGVPQLYCACTNLIPLQLQSPIILQSAKLSVQHINKQLPGKCKQFKLERITGAAVLVNYTTSSTSGGNDQDFDVGNKTIELAIGFRIKPGQFEFESIVRVITVPDNNNYSPITSSSKKNEEVDRLRRTNTVIQIKEKILRTSRIEDKKTWCCANNSFLELYCHCDFFKFIFWFYWLRD